MAYNPNGKGQLARTNKGNMAAPQVIDINPTNSARGAMGDGGFFDATGGANPVFTIMPREDGWSVFPIFRLYLAALRHHAPKTIIGTIAIIYGVSFTGSFGLNFLRGDVRRCSGDSVHRVVSGWPKS